MAQNVSKTTTDHEAIRRWVEERGGWPAEVETTGRGGQTGIIRIDFPGYAGEGKLRRISWDEWFRKFDDSSLAFVHEESTAGGQRSNFNKLVSRETVRPRAEGGGTARRGASRGGSARGGARGGARAKTAGGAAGRGGTKRATAKRGATKRAASKRGGGRRQATRAEAARTASRGGTKRRPSGRGASRRGGR